jgi:ABC-type uncharacterized transport system fused permease/ATPase subunit
VHAAEARQIAVSKSRKYLKTKRLTVQTPDGRRTLAHNVSFELKPGEHLLIMGESGFLGRARSCVPLLACGRPVAGSLYARPSAA